MNILVMINRLLSRLELPVALHSFFGQCHESSNCPQHNGNHKDNILVPMVDKLLSRVELIEALCSVFEVNANEIVIVKNVEESEVDDNIRILCITLIAKAQFALIVEIYLRDYSLIPDSEAFAIGKLCDFLKCRALVSDNLIDPDPLNPCSWVLVKGDQDFEHVYITNEELEAYDNAEEYELQ